MMYLVAAALGALAMAIVWFITNEVQARRLPAANRNLRQALEGVWIEFIPDSIGRRLSVGRIYFDKRKGAFLFDGTNYQDDFHPYCHFQTVTSNFDISTLKLYYTFAAQMTNELDKTYYGFGWVSLGKDNGMFTVEDGHYISANIDGRPMSHTMSKPPILQAKRSWKKNYTPDEMKTIVENAGLAQHFVNDTRKIR